MTTLKGVDDETEKGRKKWRICFIFPIHNFHNFSLLLTRFDDRRRMRSTTTSSDDEEHEEDEADSPMVGVRMNNDNNNIRKPTFTES